MKNEIGRKITSLTIMAIMLASVSAALPGAIPSAAAANANLFVSAENSQFNNYMSGPQIVEVVVIDSSISDTDQGKGEPDVTVNGKDLRMAQATDGNWYGYFGDRKQTQIAQALGSDPATASTGMYFGAFCTAASADTEIGINGDFGDTVGVIISGAVLIDADTDPNADGGVIDNDCATPLDVATVDYDTASILREAKDLNLELAGDNAGQVGIVDANADDLWPFIQLYTLNPTGNVVIQYNKGGNVQSTTLTFDETEAFAGLSADRSTYPQGAQVHLTVTDPWLNIDPTDEDSWTFSAAGATPGAYYQLFDENGGIVTDGAAVAGVILTRNDLDSLMCEDNCLLTLNPDVQGKGNVLTIQDNDDSELTSAVSEDPAVATTLTLAAGGEYPVTISEQGPKSGVFGTYDESDKSVLKITDGAARGTSASASYVSTEKQTIKVGFGFATIDIQPTDVEWNSGEEIPVVLVDSDANLNSRVDEDLDFNNPAVKLIPAIKIGTPATLILATAAALDADDALVQLNGGDLTDDGSIEVQKFSDRMLITLDADVDPAATDLLSFQFGTMNDFFNAAPVNNADFQGYALLNYDLRSLANTGNAEGLQTVDIDINGEVVGDDVPLSGLIGIPDANAVALGALPKADPLIVTFTLNEDGANIEAGAVLPVAIDVFGFGFDNDGEAQNERVANEIIRAELEETGDNTSTFAGTLQYTMINQLNIFEGVDIFGVYGDIVPINDKPTFIVPDDFDDEDAPRISYLDRGADGVPTQVSDQQDAPTHSGVVSLNAESYKVADTVTITLQDADLNVDSDLIDIYTAVDFADAADPADVAIDTVGTPDLVFATKDAGTAFSFGGLGRLLDVTFDDERWASADFVDADGNDCTAADPVAAGDDGLASTGFTLVETDVESGIFTGDFQIPADYCQRAEGEYASTTGTDIEVNYVDFRDASGEIIEVGDGAGVRANTGSISLDRTVYPVPFGTSTDLITGDTGDTDPNNFSIFPIHSTGIGIAGIDVGATTSLKNGDVILHVRVNDPDFDLSAAGEDTIGVNVREADSRGPVKVTVARGASEMTLAYAGGTDVVAGLIDTNGDDLDAVQDLGPITEIAPDAGIFEFDLPVKFSDGPSSALCKWDSGDINFGELVGDDDGVGLQDERFNADPKDGENFCILQGDIINVEYLDPTDASGDENTVTDSATFDLRNGVLQSDKSVYIIGGDMILTLIEPDFDLDNDSAETFDLDLIEWDSDADTVTMGDIGGESVAFDAEPSDFRETGDSTGIFQVVVEIPAALGGDKLERGEEIVFEYSDWGPSGSDYVGQENEDINLTIFTSNFGATVELDQKVYTWTDKVYITIVAPDHNFDSNLIDEIGNTPEDPIKISTRGQNLKDYKLVETGTDTGIFTGEVILTGFEHDADGNADTGDADTGSDTNPITSADAAGPTDGFLEADDDDGITVSFEFSEDETIVGSALIRWNIGEVQWLEASYPASGTGVVRIIDPDMNLNPEAVDNFNADVWSDSDAGGIDLTVTETNEATGIFEGTVFFTTTDESSGHRLRVAEGDTVTAEYEDNTLPNPYTTADELDISATSLIGTIVPPLERAPAANLRTVDAFGNSLSTVSIDQQVQITADLANGQDREQAFAYLVQIQDGNGVTVSLAWITGSLSAGQSFSPALSWIPTDAGTYTATAFVWESVDNPTALSPPVSTTIIVQ